MTRAGVKLLKKKSSPVPLAMAGLVTAGCYRINRVRVTLIEKLHGPYFLAAKQKGVKLVVARI